MVWAGVVNFCACLRPQKLFENVPAKYLHDIYMQNHDMMSHQLL